MIEYFFHPDFVPAVKCGTKHLTIRQSHKGAMPGEKGVLLIDGMGYEDRIAEVTITNVDPLKMWRDETGAVRITLWNIYISNEAILDLARNDGFPDEQAMCSWFEKKYGLPFSGYLHIWEAPHIMQALEKIARVAEAQR